MNMWTSVHFLAAIDNGGYYEADVAKENLFRDELGLLGICGVGFEQTLHHVGTWVDFQIHAQRRIGGRAHRARRQATRSMRAPRAASLCSMRS